MRYVEFDRAIRSVKQFSERDPERFAQPRGATDAFGPVPCAFVEEKPARYSLRLSSSAYTWILGDRSWSASVWVLVRLNSVWEQWWNVCLFDHLLRSMCGSAPPPDPFAIECPRHEWDSLVPLFYAMLLEGWEFSAYSAETPKRAVHADHDSAFWFEYNTAEDRAEAERLIAQAE